MLSPPFIGASASRDGRTAVLYEEGGVRIALAAATAPGVSTGAR
jgi:hypothetical protein